MTDVALIPQQPALSTEEALRLLAQWHTAKSDLSAAQAKEIMLRKQLFRHFFPDPKEGTNTFVLPDSYQIKGTHKINRKVDEAALRVLATPGPDNTPSRFQQAGISYDKLFKWEPDLVLKQYRELTAEQQQVADLCITSSEGTPQMTIAPPAAKGSK